MRQGDQSGLITMVQVREDESPRQPRSKKEREKVEDLRDSTKPARNSSSINLQKAQ